MISFPKTFDSVASRWQRALILVAAAVSLGVGNAAGQAVVEYGGAAAAIGGGGSAFDKAASALRPLSQAAAIVTETETKSDQSPSAHLPMRETKDVVGANRRALEAKAGKDAAKLMLRSVPIGAQVWIDGRAIGTTPLLVIVAPGVYKVEMEATQMEPARQKVDLLPKESREVLLTLASRYPARVELSWQHH